MTMKHNEAKCPKCGGENLKAETSGTVSFGGASFVESANWKQYDPAHCLDCGHTGDTEDFFVREFA